jgi:hypothetical protein
MKKYVILTSSILLVLIGILIEDRGLAMHVTAGGEAVYQISSGTEDGLILKFGLYSFVITILYSANSGDTILNSANSGEGWGPILINGDL